MKFRNNVLIHYTLVTFFSISVFAMIFAYVITKWSVKLQIDKHIEVYPRIIRQKLKDSPELTKYIIDKDYLNHQADMKELAKGPLNIESIVRVKIWDINNTVLWSDESSLIGDVILAC